ncbi:MAG: hypothetical protein AAF211_08040 [Myxococcota bacterium]
MLLVWAAAETALALSCSPGFGSSNVDDVDVVPPDVRIVLFHSMPYEDPPAPTFTRPDGTVFAGSADWSERRVVVTPNAPLPEGPYDVYIGAGWVRAPVIAFETTITVEDAPSLSPPAPPAILDIERRSPRAFFEGLFITFEPSQGTSYAEVEVATDETFSDGQILGVGPSGIATFGETDCSGQGYERDLAYFVRIRGVDLRGQTSVWSPPVRSGPKLFAGCRNLPLGPATSLPLLALMLLASGRCTRRSR